MDSVLSVRIRNVGLIQILPGTGVGPTHKYRTALYWRGMYSHTVKYYTTTCLKKSGLSSTPTT